MQHVPPGTKPLSDARTLVRGGAAGDLGVRYQRGEPHSQLVLAIGLITNRDAASRVSHARMVLNSVPVGYLVHSAALAANGTLTFPSRVSAQTTWAPAGIPLYLPRGTGNYLEALVEAVAAGEDASFGVLVYALDGGSLLVTEVNS